jgi:hypothetical protein
VQYPQQTVEYIATMANGQTGLQSPRGIISVKGQAASIRKMVEQTLEDYLEPMVFSNGHD